MYSLRLRSCKKLDAFIISSLPSRLKVTLQTAGPLHSADVTLLPGQPDLVLSAGKTLAGKRGQGRGVAEVGQALDEEMFLLILVAALEVIGAEILIRLAGF